MKKYNIIYADPPWNYAKRNTGRNSVSGADSKYITLSNEDLAAMPISQVTADNAICFMWATVPLLNIAFPVMEAWGFQYKTMTTWHKMKTKGLGHWFRGCCEHLLVGVKGQPKAFRSQDCNFYESEYDLIGDQSISHVPGKHSEKPQYFRELINTASLVSFDQPVKLELFARGRGGMFPEYEYEGWDLFGNQVEKSIMLPRWEIKGA